MHNKRIGRDDVLKIEVSAEPIWQNCGHRLNMISGLGHHRPHRGGLTQAVTVLVVADENGHHQEEATDHHRQVDDANTLHARMIEMNAVETETMMTDGGLEAHETVIEIEAPTETIEGTTAATIETAAMTATTATNAPMVMTEKVQTYPILARPASS